MYKPYDEYIENNSRNITPVPARTRKEGKVNWRLNSDFCGRSGPCFHWFTGSLSLPLQWPLRYNWIHSVSDDHAKGEKQWNGLRFILDSILQAPRGAKSVCTCPQCPVQCVPQSHGPNLQLHSGAEGLFHPPLESQESGVCMETSWTILL